MNLEWRVLNIEKQNGFFNTALDNTILKEVSEGNSPPTLLFTEWKPTVSLGRNQSYRLDVDEESCKRYGVDIVRRKSGGQAVFLDEGYFVFSTITPKGILSNDLSHLRKFFCDISIDTLNELGVPASFHEPDNIIVEKPYKRTLGNSGQIIRRGGLIAHGSVRYKLINLVMMLDVLKVNGYKLQAYEEEIKRVITDAYTYNPDIKKDHIKNVFLSKFSEMCGGTLFNGTLTADEKRKLNFFIEEERKKEWLMGEENYPAKGVCYFFLDGNNLVPSLQNILPYNKPSTITDSTIN